MIPHTLASFTDPITGKTEHRRIQDNLHRVYDPKHGRWLQRDPAGYVDGSSLYEYVAGNPTGYLDPYGLRGRTAEEDFIIRRLGQLAAAAEKGVDDIPPDPEFAKAVRAVIFDYAAFIYSLKDKESPAHLNVLNAAFNLWADNTTSRSYRLDGGGLFEFNWRGKNKCNKYVADALRLGKVNQRVIIKQPYPLAGEWADPNSTKVGAFKAVWEVRRLHPGTKPTSAPSPQGDLIIQVEMVGDVALEGSGVRREEMGDIVAFGEPGASANNAHVGIYLGHGLYISATDLARSVQEGRGVIIKGIPKTGRRLYRSVPDKE